MDVDVLSANGALSASLKASPMKAYCVSIDPAAVDVADPPRVQVPTARIYRLAAVSSYSPTWSNENNPVDQFCMGVVMAVVKNVLVLGLRQTVNGAVLKAAEVAPYAGAAEIRKP